MLTRSLLVLCLFASFAPAKEPFRFAAAKHDNAELKYVNHVPVLFVSGDPSDIGTGVGSLTLKPTKKILNYPRDLLDLTSAGALWKPLIAAGKGMFRRFPGDFAKELEAMTKAADADRDLVIAGNTFFDLKKSFACSAVLIDKDKSATGHPLFGRNLDYPSLGYIHEYSLVTVYQPKGKLGFVSVTFPGLLGVVSGMNEAGVCVAVLEVFDVKEGEPHFSAQGTPYALCLRRVMEKARTLKEAIDILDALPRTTCINVAIADKDEVAILEVTPKKIIRRTPTQGLCAATNHFCSRQLRPEDPINMDESFERLATLEKLRTKKTVSLDQIYRQLDQVALGTVTLQSMVFEPAAGKLHVSIGCMPATKGALRTLDLATFFKNRR